jgi:glycosyltransferase involved in cell wall biosynthesis
MKTLFVTDSISRANGGIFISEAQLQRTLHLDCNVQTQVLSLRDSFSDEDTPAWHPLPVNCCPVLGPKSIGFSTSLLPIMLHTKSDLASFAGLWKYPSLAGRLWAKRTGKPYLIAPHGMLDPWAVKNSRFKKAAAGWLFQDGHLAGAACLRALCASEAESIRAYGLKNPICIIPNGIDLPSLKPAPPSGRKMLLFLGRIHPKKGLPSLLDAWAQIKSSEWDMVIVGWDQGGHEEDLKRQATALGISWDTQIPEKDGKVNLFFLGPQFGERKTALYEKCSAFILPSLSEGLPMSILEAWSYAKPVLMTEACNLPEGLRSKASLAITSDVSGVYSGLQQLLVMSDTDLAAMGARGRHLVANHFSWSRIAADMESVYRWMLGGGPPPSCVQ